MTPELFARLADKQRELIVRLEQPRSIGPIRRAARIVPVRSCWRLGTVILDEAGGLYAAGTVIRSQDERQHGYPSRLAEERAELRAAARRGGITAGQTLNIDPIPLPIDAPVRPLRRRDGVLELEWSRGSWVALEPYLLDRAALLPTI